MRFGSHGPQIRPGQHRVGAVVRAQPVQGIEVVSRQAACEPFTKLAQHRARIGAGSRRGAVEIDLGAAHSFDVEARTFEVLAPVRVDVPPTFTRKRMSARLESRCADPDVVGKKSRLGFHFDYYQERSRIQRIVELPQEDVGVLDVMQRQSRPHEIGRVDGRPAGVQIRLDSLHPAPKTVMAGSVADSGQHLRRPIDGNHLRFGEPCGESARTRPRSGPHVDDDTRIDPIGDPVDQSVQIASMHVASRSSRSAGESLCRCSS